MPIEEIIALFHKEKASEYTLESIRLDEDDSRWILYVDVDQSKYVIKIASNGFTTAERIRGWVDIIAEYQKNISCIEYTQIDALEKYAHDRDKLQQLFDFMEHELIREDIDFRGAMLN